MNKRELESTVNDAARMARVTVEFIGQVLDFDALKPRALSQQERQLLLFVVTQTMVLVEQARDAFYDDEPEGSWVRPAATGRATASGC